MAELEARTATLPRRRAFPWAVQ